MQQPKFVTYFIFNIFNINPEGAGEGEGLKMGVGYGEAIGDAGNREDAAGKKDIFSRQ